MTDNRLSAAIAELRRSMTQAGHGPLAKTPAGIIYEVAIHYKTLAALYQRGDQTATGAANSGRHTAGPRHQGGNKMSKNGQIELRHPVTGQAATAQRVKLWRVKGRVSGLVLKFADGHIAELAYEKIRELQEGGEAIEN